MSLDEINCSWSRYMDSNGWNECEYGIKAFIYTKEMLYFIDPTLEYLNEVLTSSGDVSDQ